MRPSSLPAHRLFFGTALPGGVLGARCTTAAIEAHLDSGVVLHRSGVLYVASVGLRLWVSRSRSCNCLNGSGLHRIGGSALTLGMGHHRLFIIAVLCGALPWACNMCHKTRFGGRLRASVDDQRVAAGMGINVNIVFLSTSILAGLAVRWALKCWGSIPSFPPVHDLLF